WDAGTRLASVYSSSSHMRADSAMNSNFFGTFTGGHLHSDGSLPFVPRWWAPPICLDLTKGAGRTSTGCEAMNACKTTGPPRPGALLGVASDEHGLRPAQGDELQHAEREDRQRLADHEHHAERGWRDHAGLEDREARERPQRVAGDDHPYGARR